MMKFMDICMLFYCAECLGAFANFTSVEGARVGSEVQYIVPDLNFSCDGNVTQWKVGLESGGNGQEVNLEIWRSMGAGVYSRVTEVVYTKTVGSERIATVPVSMSVMAGDMVGFNGELQLHTSPNAGFTIFSTGATSSTTLSNLSPTMGSPYIIVSFGK